MDAVIESNTVLKESDKPSQFSKIVVFAWSKLPMRERMAKKFDKILIIQICQDIRSTSNNQNHDYKGKGDK